MKKRILSFLMVLLMVVSIIPFNIFAEGEPEPTPPEVEGTSEPTTEPVTDPPCDTCGAYDCESEHLNWCADCRMDDCGQNHCPTCGTIDCTADHGAPAAETPEEPEVHPMVDKVVKLKSDLTSYSGYRGENLSPTIMGKGSYPSVMKVTAVLEKDGVAYCRLAAVKGSWSFQDYDDDFYLEAAKLVEATWCAECEEYECGVDHSQPENTCKCCENCTGAEGCECGCENCQFCEKEPENTCECGCESCTGAEDCECKCGNCDFCEKEPENTCECGCENCTGAEDCECKCGNCDFCEKEEEPTDPPTPTDPPASSEPVYTDEDTGVSVELESLVDGITLEVDPNADVSGQLAAFGIPAANQVFGMDITLKNGGEEYQPGGALVKIPVNAASGTKVGILHTHGNSTTFMGLTEVLSDGMVQFYTDSFSEFAGFTVDFHYNGVDFSIDGRSSILLSDLFAELGIDEDATAASSVVFSDNTLVQVSREGNDWLLTSLEAFSTNETLIITFDDGRTIVIDVTDASKGVQSTNNQVHLSTSGTSKTYQIFGKLYPNVNGDYTSFATTVFGVEVDFVLYEGNAYPGSGNGAEIATAWIDQAFAGVQFSLTGNYWFEVYDTYRCQVSEKGTNNFVFDSTNISTGREVYIRRYPRTTYSNNSYCTVTQASVMSDSKTTRTVYVYANDTQVGSWIGYFPDRNSASASDLSVTPYGNWKRRGDVSDSATVVVSGGNYYVYLVSQNTIKYNTNGGSGTFADQIKTYGVQLNLHSAEPTKAGYKFNYWVSSYDGSTWAKGANFTPDRADTLVANYSPITYTATFNANGGSVNPTSRTFDIEGALSLPTPTRTGYTFTGWKVTSAAGNWTNAESYSSANIEKGKYGDVTFTAQWTPITYSVSFNGNGATSGTMANQSFTYDVAQNLKSNAFSRAYTVTYNTDGGDSISAATATATFNGWEDRGSIVYKGTTYSYTTFDAPFYANKYGDLMNAFGYNKYNLLNHWVTYTVNGSETRIARGDAPGLYPNGASVSNLATTNGYTVPLYADWILGSVTLPTPTKAGYTFTGWSDGSNTYASGATYTPTANVTLTALWEKSGYTVTWKNWNDTVLETDTNVPYGTAPTYNGSTPTKAADAQYSYTFKEWSPAITNVTGNATYTAVYNKTANTYKVTWIVDDEKNVQNIQYGAAITKPADPAKTGYAFLGWSPAVPATMPANDVTFTAQWKPIYKVTLDNQSANTPGTEAYWFIHNTVYNGVYYYTDANCTTALANYTITKPTRTGYIFGGYYTGTNGQGTQYVNADGVCINNLYKQEGNVTLFAKWTPITYTVTYNGNPSHDGTTADSTHSYDVEKTLTPNGYQRSWYKFMGWNTMADGSGDNYADQASVKNLTDENGATVTLYAQWKPIYKITLDSQEQTEGTPNFYFVHTLDAYYSEETCITALEGNKIVPPTKHGYTFAGYYTQENGLGTRYIDAFGKISSACCQLGQDTTLYAKWDIITYTITYQFEDGVTPDRGVSYNYETDVKLMVPTREGYKFLGWTNLSPDQYLVTHNWEYTNYDNTSDGMQNPGDNQWGNVTLKARWQEQYRYVLSFNSNGGSTVEPITKEWCDDEEWTFTWDQTKNPTRTGYTFMGWATEANSNDAVTGPDSNSYTVTGKPTETETKTLYAIWQRDIGTVVLDYTGDGAPVIVTVECTTSEGGVDSEKIRIQTVITGDVTLSNLPTGAYSVTAEPGRGNYTASANPGSVTIGKGESKTVTVTTGAKGNNWLTGFARATNRCS